ncbi:hypothetical protein [Escherichia coli]|uniref:hypothetical protein n=1 Tax=Escherichia coli TaxID=562 RepID=UPI00287AE1DE|nr:hypothetical protein [Escherichia coli]MDS1619982.1 hypothetical protein [Escherichia coli]
MEQALLERYPAWQLRNERAVADWNRTHPQPQAGVITIVRCTQVSTGRINEMLAQYDNFRPVRIEERELIALLQEVLELRHKVAERTENEQKRDL